MFEISMGKAVIIFMHLPAGTNLLYCMEILSKLKRWTNT